MSFEDNNALFVDNDNVRNALDFELLIGGAVAIRSQVVLNIGPALACDVTFQLGKILVETQGNDSDFAFPGGVVLYHLGIVSHGSLAGGTPGSPEVVEDNLAFLVFDVGCTFLEN